jgi:hypothetical protein
MRRVYYRSMKNITKRAKTFRPSQEAAIREAAERFGQRLQQAAYERIGTMAGTQDDVLTFLFGDGAQVDAYIIGQIEARGAR